MYLKTVNKELAIKLKELGFDLPTISCFHPRYGLYSSVSEYRDAFESPEDFDHYNSSHWVKGYYSAPTLELAKQWFREKHGIIITVSYDLGDYELFIDVDKHSGSTGYDIIYGSYEEALEAGLLEACNLKL